MIWENKCQIHLKAAAVELLFCFQWVFPEECYPSYPQCCQGTCGLGSLDGWKVGWSQALGVTRDDGAVTVWPALSDTQAVSPALWVWVADDIIWNPQWINARCLIGDEWISVFHWNLQICRQTMLLFPSQPDLYSKKFSCVKDLMVLCSPCRHGISGSLYNRDLNAAQNPGSSTSALHHKNQGILHRDRWVQSTWQAAEQLSHLRSWG